MVFVTLNAVFPAHAGMSRSLPAYVWRHGCFPRSRGDEPFELTLDPIERGFSPLTRG